MFKGRNFFFLTEPPPLPSNAETLPAPCLLAAQFHSTSLTFEGSWRREKDPGEEAPGAGQGPEASAGVRAAEERKVVGEDEGPAVGPALAQR